jgi:hypothetical protein
MRLRELLVALLWMLFLPGLTCQTPSPPQPPPEPPSTGGAPVVDAGTGGAAAAGTGGQAGDPGPVARCQFREVRAMARALRSETPRVIHGQEADLAQYTGLCSLQSVSGHHFCTAELLAPEWLLTAGHCMPPSAGDVAVCGCADLQSSDCRVSRVAMGYVHEQYSAWYEGHDLALVRVVDAFDGIEPVPLSDVSLPGEAAYVAGWGVTCSTCGTSQYLLEAELRLLTNGGCSVEYPGSITDSMVCAIGVGSDAAPGDSGGFLGQYVDGGFVQVGVVSWGRACTAADPGHDPLETCVGVYARLAGEVAGIQACIGGG